MKSNFLKFTLLIAFAVMLFAVPNDADAATYDIYTYTISGNEVEITGCKTSASGAIVIPREIEGKKVTSIGWTAFSGCRSLTSITIPESVTSIRDYAFDSCRSLTSITIPDSVTSIGWAAFSYCTSLTSITIPESVTSISSDAFRGCTSLEEITLPFVGAKRGITGTANSVFGYIFGYSSSSGSGTTCQYYSDYDSYYYYYIPSTLKKVTITDETIIPYGAFYNCSNLISITILESVTSIGDVAFSDCTSLTSITIPESVTSIGSGAFSYCTSLTSITIPESVTSIGSGAFYGCTSLTSITIPDSVTSIGERAFYGCESLESITIPDSVTSIGSFAFGGCNNLNGVYISDLTAWCNVDFGDYASNPLYFAEKLYLNGTLVTEVVIPDSVTKINAYTFYNCMPLVSVTIHNSVTSIGSCAFTGCCSLEKICYNSRKLIANMTSYSNVFLNTGGSGEGIDVVFGDEVEEIPSYLFCVSNSSFIPNIKSVTIGKNVASIGRFAFSGCSTITSITIPESVTSIGDGAFHECSLLASIEISESVTTIGSNAFYKCISLVSITIPKSVKSIAISAFLECNNLEEVNISDMDAWCSIDFESASANPLMYARNLYLNGTLVTDAVLSDSATEIGSYAFYNCSYLTSITIPSSVTSIGNGSFVGCSNLESIHISDIDAWCGIEFDFYSDNPLYYGKNLYLNGNLVTEVVLSNVTTKIGAFVFYNCKSLTSIIMSDSVTSIGNKSFYNCTSLTEIIVSNSVTSIGEEAFSGCTSLEEITLPFIGAKRGITGTVDSVFGYIFGYTTSSESGTTRQYYSDSGSAYYYIPSTLKKVTITDETVIPHGAFYNCVNLTDVTIKGNPTAIMAKAFAGHESLWNITIKSKNVRYANNRIFNSTDMPTIYGYAGSTTEAYAEKYGLWFEVLGEEESGEYTLDADAVLVNGKIVIDITTDKPVTDQALHVALYNDASKLVDYIVVPLNKAYNSFNVVFKDETNSSFAKVFLWDGLESMTPIAQAKTVTIKR